MSKQEHSFGIIPILEKRKKWEVLLIRHGKGHWAFPKGHAEKGERPLQCAMRELYEEVGLHVSFLYDVDPIVENYFFKKDNELIHKTVTYFLANTKGDLKWDNFEITDALWLPLDQAIEQATYKGTKEVCKQLKILSQKKIPKIKMPD
jgi:bis(5'-nucleosidyl)-tetraphosphatase